MNLSKGVTLIELIVAMAVLAIVASMALPSFNRFIIDNRVVAQANGLLSAAHFARSEAVKLGAVVSLSVNADGSWCVHTGNACTTIGTNPTQIRSGVGEPANEVFRSANVIPFDRRGEVGSAVTIRIQPSACNSDAGRARTLTVSNVGRAAVIIEDCST